MNHFTDLECPTCYAPAGELCSDRVNMSFTPVPHPARYRLWRDMTDPYLADRANVTNVRVFRDGVEQWDDSGR
jgi:hypothetical protein